MLFTHTYPSGLTTTATLVMDSGIGFICMTGHCPLPEEPEFEEYRIWREEIVTPGMIEVLMTNLLL